MRHQLHIVKIARGEGIAICLFYRKKWYIWQLGMAELSLCYCWKPNTTIPFCLSQIILSFISISNGTNFRYMWYSLVFYFSKSFAPPYNWVITAFVLFHLFLLNCANFFFFFCKYKIIYPISRGRGRGQSRGGF